MHQQTGDFEYMLSRVKDSYKFTNRKLEGLEEQVFNGLLMREFYEWKVRYLMFI